jgi:hypothetical protein
VNKRGELAVVGALVCAAAAGVVIGRGAGRRPRRDAGTPHVPPSELAAPFALPAARDRHHSVAVVSLAAPERLPARRATYATVRIGPGRIARAAVAVTGAGAMLIGATLVGVAVANPQVTALAAPSVAYPGTTAVVAYADAGFGAFSYGLDAPSRHRAGALAGRQGAFEIPITQRDVNGDIVVVVRAAGPFGSDVRVARIRVLARPRAIVTRMPWNGVRVDALSLASATVASGGEIAVRYRSNATSGSVALRDVRGGTWQSKPLSTTGFTRLRAPVSDRDAPFSVVLQARRNGAAIENSVALVVTASAGPLAPRAPSPAPPPIVTTRDIPAVTQSGSLLVTSAGAGRTATVIELTGAGGIALQRATPRADGTTELRMPIVTAPQSYLISVSYQSGAGRESSFHPIRVVPSKR